MSAMIGAALGAGLAGSVHCAAMCGPLAMASSRRPVDAVGYLAGRLAGYLALGALFGVVGEHALCELPVETVQTIALVVVAVFAAWKGFRAFRPARPSDLGPRPVLLRIGARKPPFWARVLAVLPPRGLTLGLATAILPCGMLIAAWTLAAAAEDAGGGALTMAAFWAGSLPGLLVPMLARRFAVRIPPTLTGMAWLGLAAWLAVRPILMSGHHHH